MVTARTANDGGLSIPRGLAKKMAKPKYTLGFRPGLVAEPVLHDHTGARLGERL